ncbi:MAG TPA: DUF177 domain-containing protein [Elusimicrobiota bacterium]|nr:DUF177 domain-containing protein [Elusimicrobiota bacterium]
MSAPLKFPLTEVKELGELTVNASVPSADFVGVLSEGELVGPVSVSGTIRRVDDEASFEGVAQGRWRFECTRCLVPVDGEWREKLEVLVPIDSGPLDLTEEVRQSIGLAQPMKTLCKPDCKGFCAVCGKNRNLADCGHAQAEEERISTRPRLTPRPDKG